MRFIVLLFILLCLLSVAKVALLRWREKPAPPAATLSAWEADGRLRAYPTARLSRWNGLVYSPYLQETLLDVEAFQPGDLVRCGGSLRPFYVPLRHDLHFGEIAGEWKIRCDELPGGTEYHLRFLPETAGVSGTGRRVMDRGRRLPPSEQPEISLRGHFDGDQLVCGFEERLDEDQKLNGRFRWAFSSDQDLLQGTVEFNSGIFVSEGRRIAGSRGQFPTSGETAEDFVPPGWKLLDHLTGELTAGSHDADTSDGDFLVLVTEEPGRNPLRWLVLARRLYRSEDFQTILFTPHACRSRGEPGQTDPFQGLALPKTIPTPGGTFGLRHHQALDYQHAGIDLWFRYDGRWREWRLAEGKRYRWDLNDTQNAPVSEAVIPGTALVDFKIEEIQFRSPAPPALGTAPARELTAVP